MFRTNNYSWIFNMLKYNKFLSSTIKIISSTYTSKYYIWVRSGIFLWLSQCYMKKEATPTLHIYTFLISINRRIAIWQFISETRRARITNFGIGIVTTLSDFKILFVADVMYNYYYVSSIIISVNSLNFEINQAPKSMLRVFTKSGLQFSG